MLLCSCSSSRTSTKRTLGAMPLLPLLLLSLVPAREAFHGPERRGPFRGRGFFRGFASDVAPHGYHNGLGSAAVQRYDRLSDKRGLGRFLFPWGMQQEGNGEEGDDEEEGAIPLQRVQDATVRIFCRHSFPDVLQPWQRERQVPSTSSGFCIEGRRIVTNAHAVEHGTLIQVRRREKGKKYVASVVAEAPECDLAVLTVDDDEFWSGMPSVVLGLMPALDDDVKVVGYPVGGDTMSITAGVVSRVEMQTYAQASAELLAIQIDAAINPGNSGGPVVDDSNRVVGIAFQSLADADVENCGYVIPAEILRHLLEDIRRHGCYTGFPSLGVSFQGLESPWLRRHVGLEAQAEDGEDELGILATHTLPCVEQIQVGDVLLAVDKLPVSSDGSIPFPGRPGERVSVRHHFCRKFEGDSVLLDLRRRGRVLQVPFELKVLNPLVPHHFAGQAPPYLIAGGLVFSPLSIPYLESLEDDGFDEEESSHGKGSGHYGYMLERASFEHAQDDCEEIVVMTQVLAHESNIGYLGLEAVVLESFNGVKVTSLRHLALMLARRLMWEPLINGEICSTESDQDDKSPTDLVFKFYRGGLVVLDEKLARIATREICEEQGIGNPISATLRSWVATSAAETSENERILANRG